MRRLVAALLVAVACTCANAADVAAILMHGKWGSPGARDDSLASALQKQGYAVVSPEMPWSRRRIRERLSDSA